MQNTKLLSLSAALLAVMATNAVAAENKVDLPRTLDAMSLRTKPSGTTSRPTTPISSTSKKVASSVSSRCPTATKNGLNSGAVTSTTRTRAVRLP